MIFTIVKTTKSFVFASLDLCSSNFLTKQLFTLFTSYKRSHCLQWSRCLQKLSAVIKHLFVSSLPSLRQISFLARVYPHSCILKYKRFFIKLLYENWRIRSNEIGHKMLSLYEIKRRKKNCFFELCHFEYLHQVKQNFKSNFSKL